MIGRYISIFIQLIFLLLIIFVYSTEVLILQNLYQTVDDCTLQNIWNIYGLQIFNTFDLNRKHSLKYTLDMDRSFHSLLKNQTHVLVVLVVLEDSCNNHC